MRRGRLSLRTIVRSTPNSVIFIAACIVAFLLWQEILGLGGYFEDYEGTDGIITQYVPAERLKENWRPSGAQTVDTLRKQLLTTTKGSEKLDKEGKIAEEGEDPWEKVTRGEMTRLPKQLPESIFGDAGIPKFYTDSIFIMQYNHPRFERLREWKSRLHFPEHVVVTVPLSDDQHWPAGDPGVFDCGEPGVKGMMAYHCVVLVIEDERFANPPLGYMFFHFDIVLRWSHWAQFNYSQYIQPQTRGQWPWTYGLYPNDWMWWPTKWGMSALNNVYEDKKWKDYIVTSDYAKRARAKGTSANFKWVLFGFSDVYFLPTALAPEFVQTSKIFVKHSLFAEIVCPMHCMLFGPEKCAETKGSLFPPSAVCDFQDMPQLDWIHHVNWANPAEKQWWNDWHLQPSQWIPAKPPIEDSPQLKYDRDTRLCYTKFDNIPYPDS